MNLRVVAWGIAALAVVAAALVFVFARSTGPPPAFVGTPVAPAKSASDATLTDARSRPAHLLDPGAAATFVFFGYTHCPDECPLALASLARANALLTPAERGRTRIVFVTVDPAHDTPAALSRYVAHFDARIVALTGTHDQLAPVWKAYGVTVVPNAGELIDHGGTIFGIDRAHAIAVVYPPDVAARDLAHDAALLAN